MDTSDFRIIYLFTDLLLPLIVGYLLHRHGKISDALINRILRLNVIVIYTILALMSCWTLPISWDLALIPVYGILIVLFPGLVGWAFFIRKYHNPLDRGAYLANAMMSNITTLGGVCAFILYGEQGFAYAQIMGIFQTLMLVLAVFPMAQYYYLQHKDHGASGKIRLCVADILLSWNQLSILGMAAGLILNALGIDRPPAVGTAFEGLIHFGAWFGMLPVGALVNLHRARRYAPYTLDLFALCLRSRPARLHPRLLRHAGRHQLRHRGETLSPQRRLHRLRLSHHQHRLLLPRLSSTFLPAAVKDVRAASFCTAKTLFFIRIFCQI